MLELAIVEYYINRRISEFRLTNNKGKHYYYHPKRNIEEDGIVIGNIHDNPELLEIDKYW
jgi:hypothetical protein